jgi:GT2 family glycosyltransferase
MTAPRISVVLPTYNGARYLRESIASVLAQTEPNFELIVVDDCSTDDTPALLAEAAERDPRILVQRNATNRKLPASLNIGFRQARGGYFTWTSDDNRYEPTALATMARALDEHPHVGLVYSDFRMIDADGAVVSECAVPGVERLLAVNCVAGSFLYRREVHEKLGGYDEARFLTEDYDFWLRACRHFQLLAIREKLYRYRQHDKSLSQTRQAEIERATWQLIRERLPELRGRAQIDFGLACIYQADRCRRQGRLLEAFGNVARGLFASPISALRAGKEMLHGYYRGWRRRRASA